jgi:hypothetical protein
MSSGVPSGNVMITSSVTGEMTESFSLPLGEAHSPFTKTESAAWIEIVGFATLFTSLLNATGTLA